VRKHARFVVALALTVVFAVVGLEIAAERPVAFAEPALTQKVFLPLVISARSSVPPSSSTLPDFDHVFVVVEENKSYSQIIGSSSAPYINSLASKYGLATNYHAVRHPSLPNYLTMIGGSTFGITTDCSPSTCPINARNLADSIEASGRNWKGYMELMPVACGTATSGNYAPKHNPFVYFDDIRTNSQRCASHVVPYLELAVDLATAATTPDFAFITPDLCSDMHDCSISTGDNWLRVALPLIFSSPAWKNQHSVLFLIWDEDDSSSTNQVPALVIGPAVKPGFKSSAAYGHYNLLHTIEAAWHLPTLTPNDANAAIMSDFWR